MTASGMARVARWSIAYRWLVIAGWILLAVARSLAAARSGGRLSFAFDLPGQPAYEANTAIVKTFGSGGSEPPLVTVVRLPRGVTVQSPRVREQLEKVSGKAAAALPGAQTASWVSTGDRAFVSADGRTTFGLIYPCGQFHQQQPLRQRAAPAGEGASGPARAGSPGGGYRRDDPVLRRPGRWQ
jgi:RND superfamily putative drug exporter